MRSEEIARGEEVSRSQEEVEMRAPLNEEDLNIEEAIRARVAEGAADDGKSYEILRAGSSRSHGHPRYTFHH